MKAKKENIGIVIVLIIAFLSTSCSVQQESLLAHDSKDCLVLDYEYPYAEVLMVFESKVPGVLDSVISYKYITDVNCKTGMYLIYKNN